MAEGGNCRQERLIIAQNGKKETEKNEWNLNRGTHYSRLTYCPSGKKHKLNKLSKLVHPGSSMI